MEVIARTGLDEIFARLESGDVVDGWGIALHKDFVSLFSESGGLWQRYRNQPGWLCVHAPAIAKLAAGRPDIRVVQP